LAGYWGDKMANSTLISLLTGLPTKEQREGMLLKQGQQMAQSLIPESSRFVKTGAARQFLAGQPLRAERQKRGLLDALGLQEMGKSPTEQIRDIAMQGNLSTSYGLIDVAKKVEGIDPIAAAAFRQAASEKTIEELNTKKAQQEIRTLEAQKTQLTNNREAAISFIQSSSLPQNERNAYISAARLGTFDTSEAFENLLNRIDPKASERYIKDDDGIYDSVANQWLLREGVEDADELEVSPTDPDEYEPWSFARFQKAFKEATNDEERIAARTLLVKNHPDGWQYEMMVDTEGNTILDQNGNEKMVAMPSGNDRARFVSEFRAANNAGEVIRNRSDNLIDLTDELINQLSETDENGQYTNEVKTGFTGIVFNLIPGTNNYQFTGDVETLLANMGFNALNEARTNSQNGSSGFGQLTEKEMNLLQSLVTNLRQGGLSREEFISRLREVKQEFTRIRDVTKSTRNSPWTLKQWVGIEQPTEPERIASGGVIPGGGSTSSFTQEIGGQTINVTVGEPNAQ
jgi:hypothetical protein